MNSTRPIPRGPLLIIAALSGLIVVVGAVFYGQFEYSELCTVCGRARFRVDWQVPGTQRAYYRVVEEQPTSLSAVVDAHGLVAAHEHAWQFIRGAGNGRPIVLGSGHPVSWSLHSPHMGEFMMRMIELTDRETTLRWLEQMRSPAYARLCQAMAGESAGRRFSNRGEWEGWLADYERQHAQLIDFGAASP